MYSLSQRLSILKLTSRNYFLKNHHVYGVGIMAKMGKATSCEAQHLKREQFMSWLQHSQSSFLLMAWEISGRPR